MAAERARTVIVTGAAGALGRAIAARFAAEPGTGLVLSDVDEAGLEEAGAELGDAAVETVVADVGDAAQVDSLVEAALERFERLDVMINNAGLLSPNARMHNLEAADWERAVRVNLMGAVHGITAAVRAMRERGDGGAIVNTASIAGVTAWPYAAPYGATKAAVVQLTKVAAAEYARDRIRVNCVCPGNFRSAMSAQIPQEAMESIAEKHPLGLGEPEDLAGAFAYLASDEARWTTGVALCVDGGYTAL